MQQIENLVTYAIVFLYSGVFPLWSLYWIQRYLWEMLVYDHIGVLTKTQRRNDLPLITGAIERVLYIGAILLGHPEFIAFWIGLKAAGSWKAWTEGVSLSRRKSVIISGRSIFGLFIIGSAISLMHAIGGFILIKWLNAETLKAVTAAGIIFLHTITIQFVLCIRHRRMEKK